jgi:hypothetical protein
MSFVNHSAINEHVSSVYNAIQAETLLQKTRTILRTEDYERLCFLLHWFVINPSVAEHTILQLLSTYNVYLEKEFEMFFSFTRNS